jgi:hypothetical protein
LQGFGDPFTIGKAPINTMEIWPQIRRRFRAESIRRFCLRSTIRSKSGKRMPVSTGKRPGSEDGDGDGDACAEFVESSDHFGGDNTGEDDQAAMMMTGIRL